MPPMIFGKIMEDIEQRSFVKAMIDNYAQTIYPYKCLDFKTKHKRIMSLIERKVMMIHCLVESGQIFQSIVETTELQPELKKLLNDNLKKKEQVALLKGQEITKILL